ncbi:MAG: peptidoglycan DD-metalloendopeptidase family protein [Desulforegulaceae bacterium]|nr:peptidoglycan DD-metalloendopeptidase family protein [Desulforegulaceae bacterium]
MLYFLEAIFKKLIKSAFTGVFLIVLTCAEAYSAKAVVKSSKLNMREGSLFGAPVTAVLSKGDILEVLGPDDGKWLKVKLKNKIGYVRNRPIYVEIIDGKEKIDTTSVLYKEKKDEIEKRIKKERKFLKEYRERTKTILTGLDEIDRAVNNSENRLSSVKKDYKDLIDKIREEKRKIEDTEKEIKELQPFVDKRIVSLYKLSRVGQMNLLFSADSVVDFIKRQKALKDIISADLSLIGRYSFYRNEYLELKKSLELEKEKLGELSDQIAKYLRIKEIEKEKKKALLKEIKEKEAMKLSLIDSLKEASSKLDEELKILEQKSKVKKDKELKSFASFKGLLNYPVNGKIISGFGGGRSEDGGVYAHKSGIGLKADLGEPVHSVFSGKVAFADWFKGYGNMMIIDHGDSYFTIYAHVQEYFKQKGDSVRKDEVIATIGETGSMSGPFLHFEVRHHGTALNPLSWIKK